ncbi:MAG: AAA family ATPase [Sulfuricella denitrificans]|nr:AAA family ATPase [Sulfuricella denitrificans]
MYRAHFGFNEPPFGITPDTSFFFAFTRYQEALNTLLVAVRTGEGFIKITGEVGTGKTLLCRKFMASLGGGFVTAYIPNPYLEPRTLLLAVAEDLNIAIDATMDQHHLLRTLTLGLLNYARQGKRVVLCLDEVQAMPLETLEALRLLTNLETEKRKLLQIVLFGQPELDERLNQESIRQLKQRISFHYRLGELGRGELESYVNHRLAIAGYIGDKLFTQGAIRQLYRASGGVPRLVNILAHKALLLTYGQGGKLVEAQHVRAAVADTPAARSLGWRGFMSGLLGRR